MSRFITVQHSPRLKLKLKAICRVPDKIMVTLKRICFHKDQDAKLERDIYGGVVSLDSPWGKIVRICNSLEVPVPAMVPPDPQVEIQVKVYWTLDTCHRTLFTGHWPLAT